MPPEEPGDSPTGGGSFDNGPSLKARALRLLALREHTRHELEQKLARHQPQADALRQALDELQSKGFISEERVVESVLYRRGSRLGAARVRQELKQKGVSAPALASALQRLQATEFERAYAVWQKKFNAVASNAPDRSKQARFLLTRGFAPEVVRRITHGDHDHDHDHEAD